ncbi:hypothetical protein IW492_13945 [Enterococcus sp. BWB1-3]|uniref:hypothetical protein n=1 Tax=unclassified Enterococcus TaxID=2608891 RepID=UPI00192489ED|nr:MULTISPECIES: hypothetical protein [unclassified Enterococcus]MBL1230334.1 hypothetical protein [Enterococcus sp. BWB1-3]MCB5951048.1 hypothetical protein [Enterococcus sp. BWT-B8]MCB5955122.1 hypothetical protein [Enterococcus sp. CWB-B31]
MLFIAQEQKVSFTWEKDNHVGYVEKEYENSYLVVVNDPSSDMKEKYTNRMVISKKECTMID